MMSSYSLARPLFTVLALTAVLLGSEHTNAQGNAILSIDQCVNFNGNVEPKTFTRAEQKVRTGNFTHAGIFVHRGSLGQANKGGVLRYVPFVSGAGDRLVPLIRTDFNGGQYGVPCGAPWDVTELVLQQRRSTYPAILLDGESEAVLKQMLDFAAQNAADGYVFNNRQLVMARFPITWQSGLPVVDNERKLRSLNDWLASSLSRGVNGSTLTGLLQDGQDLSMVMTTSPYRDEGSRVKVVFNSEGACAGRNCATTDSYATTAPDATPSAPADDIVDDLTAPAPEVDESSIRVSFTSQPAGISSTFLKIFNSESACAGSNPSDFAIDKSGGADQLIGVTRVTDPKGVDLQGSEWATISNGARNLTACVAVQQLEESEFLFAFNMAAAETKRAVLVISPRSGFMERVDDTRYAYTAVKQIKAWLDALRANEKAQPLTIVEIDTSGTARVLAEGESLMQMSEGDLETLWEDFEFLGNSGRALLDLTSVNTLLQNREYDRVLYLVDSRRELFNVEDMGVAFSWNATKAFSVVTLGECAPWQEKLGANFACASGDNFQRGLKTALDELL